MGDARFPQPGAVPRVPLASCEWSWASLTDADLRAVRHIGKDELWHQIAGLDRRPTTAAAWVQAHPEHEVAQTIATFRASMRDGVSDMPPVILVGPSADGDLVVMEGNKRTVAAVMGGVSVPNMRFLIGTASAMVVWPFYTY